MAGGDFFARIEELKGRVGDGTLEGKVVVDQHYALHQHEATHYAHVRGGGPFYLRNPLIENTPIYIKVLAEAVLSGVLAEAMAANMENLQSKLDPAAPIDEEPNPIKLRRSGNPIVIDNGVEVYNRPPLDPPEPPGLDKFKDRDGKG